MSQVQMITYVLAALAIVAQVMSAGMLIAALTKKASWVLDKLKLSYTHLTIFAYGVAMIATVGSLYFSDVAGYTPCKFCWYQRIVMYPQALLYLLALAINDKRVHIYGLIFSLIGAGMAFYHYLLQIGIVKTTACSVVGFSISCSDRFTTTFGYVTIPLMAFSAFALISATWILYMAAQREKKN